MFTGAIHTCVKKKTNRLYLFSLAGIPQEDTGSSPSIKPTKATDSSSSEDENQSVNPNPATDAPENSEENKTTEQSGIPQGSIHGPLESKSHHPSSDSSACFELNVLLQQLHDVNFSPSKPIKDVDSYGDIMTMCDYAKDFYAYLQVGMFCLFTAGA